MLGLESSYFHAWRNAECQTSGDTAFDWFERLEDPSERKNAWAFHKMMMQFSLQRYIPLQPCYWELNDTWLPDRTTLRYRIAMLQFPLIPEDTRQAVLDVGSKVAEVLGVEVLARVDEDKWFGFQVRS